MLQHKFYQLVLMCFLATRSSSSYVCTLQFSCVPSRLHTGCGVVCSGKRGVIKANQYITEYLGEIYPPWKWVEKEREEERQRFVLCIYVFDTLMLLHCRSGAIVLCTNDAQRILASHMSHSAVSVLLHVKTRMHTTIVSSGARKPPPCLRPWVRGTK